MLVEHTAGELGAIDPTFQVRTLVASVCIIYFDLLKVYPPGAFLFCCSHIPGDSLIEPEFK
jgi:hypothetical protein